MILFAIFFLFVTVRFDHLLENPGRVNKTLPGFNSMC